MEDLNEHVLDQAAGQELLRVEDLIVLVERHDRDDGRGVPVDRLRAYVEEIDRLGGSLAPANLDAALEERTTDSETWVGQGTIYRTGDDRVSTYPANWHERLAGETDLAEHLRVVLNDVLANDAFENSEEAFQQGGPRRGVPEGVLIDVASTIGGLSGDEANAQLTELRKRDVVSESADQHPHSRVRFLESDDEGASREGH